MSLRLNALLLPLVLSLACAAPASTVRAAAPEAALPGLVLVESSPVETTLDHADIPDAHEVWPEMVNGAARTLDVAQFYVSNAPGSRLEKVIQAVEAAADRGVKVRVLADEKFYKTYPETLERLAKRPGIEMRRVDLGKAMGGVLHAKYFVVDGREAFLGSQNFDWRSLEHIQEARAAHPGARGGALARGHLRAGLGAGHRRPGTGHGGGERPVPGELRGRHGARDAGPQPRGPPAGPGHVGPAEAVDAHRRSEALGAGAAPHVQGEEP
ncbi:phospholipase D-like domain-containing protein [Archangium gephyra]|uniref:phospholipase D-like domain-containing protein n=1 Tax=Archangium gephyra TaxID=48 RepID=UPI003B82579B